jgi:hypothetical protein
MYMPTGPAGPFNDLVMGMVGEGFFTGPSIKRMYVQLIDTSAGELEVLSCTYPAITG